MKYKITVEDILDKNKFSEEKLEFKAESHDNLFKIVEQLKQNNDFNNDEAASLGVGLKLFTGVMLKNKENPLFENLIPQFKDFIMRLKNSGKGK